MGISHGAWETTGRADKEGHSDDRVRGDRGARERSHTHRKREVVKETLIKEGGKGKGGEAIEGEIGGKRVGGKVDKPEDCEGNKEGKRRKKVKTEDIGG